MFDLNGSYDLYQIGNETQRIAEVVKGKVYHVRQHNDQTLETYEYTLTKEGMFSLGGRLLPDGKMMS